MDSTWCHSVKNKQKSTQTLKSETQHTSLYLFAYRGKKIGLIRMKAITYTCTFKKFILQKRRILLIHSVQFCS